MKLQLSDVTNITEFVFRVAVLGLLCCCRKSEGQRRCGRINSRPSSAKLQGKIVGGYEVGYFKYPWFAALEMDQDVFCGGALIGNNFVITAAHCYDDARGKLENYYMVRVGLYRQCKKEPTQTTYKVNKVFIHEKYKSNKPYYDIALLKLTGDTTPYMPICLPPRVLKDIDYEQEALIAGFGTTIEGNDNAYPCEMHEGRVLIYDNATCRSTIQRLAKDEVNYARYINSVCAGYKAGGVDTCQGDSGGPLMMFDSLTNAWQQVGVVSFGWGCGEKDAMGVYTDVSKYLGWIEKISGIKPSDYQPYQHAGTNLQPNATNSNQVNGIIDAFLRIYDHLMDSPHPPSEITIRFKNKRLAHNNTHGNQRKTKHAHKVNRWTKTKVYHAN